MRAPIGLLVLLLLPLGCGDMTADRVAFGDSVTFGYGGERGGWVSHLEKDLGTPVANFGVPTERVSDGRARFVGPAGPLALSQWAYDILLLHGGNDLAGAFLGAKCHGDCAPADLASEISLITADVAGIIDEARKHDRDLMLGTYWRVNTEACASGPLVLDPGEVLRANLMIDAYNASLMRLAEHRGVPVVRLDLLDLEQDPANFYDCIHPSDRGYRQVAASWSAAIVR